MGNCCAPTSKEDYEMDILQQLQSTGTIEKPKVLSSFNVDEYDEENYSPSESSVHYDQFRNSSDHAGDFIQSFQPPDCVNESFSTQNNNKNNSQTRIPSQTSQQNINNGILRLDLAKIQHDSNSSLAANQYDGVLMQSLSQQQQRMQSSCDSVNSNALSQHSLRIQASQVSSSQLLQNQHLSSQSNNILSQPDGDSDQQWIQQDLQVLQQQQQQQYSAYSTPVTTAAAPATAPSAKKFANIRLDLERINELNEVEEFNPKSLSRRQK